METLKEMANSLAMSSGEMTRCFGLYPNECVYDSRRITQFLTCCEEVGYAIEDGDYEAAERIIFVYLCLEKGE